MTPQGRLKLIRHLLDSDTAFDADCLALSSVSASEREKEYAALIGRLYMAVHPSSDCQNPHDDWEARNERDLKLAE